MYSEEIEFTRRWIGVEILERSQLGYLLNGPEFQHISKRTVNHIVVATEEAAQSFFALGTILDEEVRSFIAVL